MNVGLLQKKKGGMAFDLWKHGNLNTNRFPTIKLYTFLFHQFKKIVTIMTMQYTNITTAFLQFTSKTNKTNSSLLIFSIRRPGNYAQI